MELIARRRQDTGTDRACIDARRVTGLTAPGVLDGPMDGASFLLRYLQNS